MTSNMQLKRDKAALEREQARRANMTETEKQIMAARGHRGRPVPPDYEEDRSKWSTTDVQMFAAYGRKPLRKLDPDSDD